MILYIPEIGDEIILENDWTFQLYAEYRNVQLAEYFNHYYNYGVFIDSSLLPPMRKPDYDIKYPTDEEIKNSVGKFGRVTYEIKQKAYNDAAKNCTEYMQYKKDSENHYQLSSRFKKDSITVTLPKGTILKVDRIYIRKGKSDYSSITFYCKNLPNTTSKKKSKSFRFWAKLEDVNNNIVFEKVRV